MTIESWQNYPTALKKSPPSIPQIKTICCQCGILVHDGSTINGRVSHGYCIECASIIMADIKRGKYD